MNGKKLGAIVLVGARVGRSITWTPEHMINGKLVSERLEFGIMLNLYNVEDAETYAITAWGNVASGLVRMIHTGKEVHVELTPRPYKGRAFLPSPGPGIAGEAIMVNGVPLMINKMGWDLANGWGSIQLGDDAPKIVAEEIASARRPANWKDGGEGSKVWATYREAYKKHVWQPGQSAFFYAAVRLPPQGAVYPVTQEMRMAAKANVGQPGTAAPVQGGFPAIPGMNIPQTSVAAPNGFPTPGGMPINTNVPVPGQQMPVITPQMMATMMAMMAGQTPGQTPGQATANAATPGFPF